MAVPRVLISHERADGAFCHSLAAELRGAGADVWLDEHDLGWTELRQALDREMPTRPNFVVVLSPAAVASERVALAVDTALELARTHEIQQCVAVVARACTLTPGLDSFLRLDATAGIAAVRAALLDALGLGARAATGTASGTAPAVALVPAPHPARSTEREPTVLPPRLSALGYTGWRIGETELILPPLCLVHAGPFQMGDTVDPSEGPMHAVDLPIYAIARYPVIVAEYACFARAGHPLPPDLGQVTWSMQFSHLDHPVVNVSWHDAQAYAAWMRQWTGERWRLPTEAEWEKAARWDPAGSGARTYPWGDLFDGSRCNTRESGMGKTTPVGTYPNGASPCGAQDLAGNVREWTNSRYAAYPYVADDRHERVDADGDRVQRGGSWFSFASEARVAARDWHAPESVSPVVGFRLVLEAPQRPETSDISQLPRLP